jgi:hypothetical protein
MRDSRERRRFFKIEFWPFLEIAFWMSLIFGDNLFKVGSIVGSSRNDALSLVFNESVRKYVFL